MWIRVVVGKVCGDRFTTPNLLSYRATSVRLSKSLRYFTSSQRSFPRVDIQTERERWESGLWYSVTSFVRTRQPCDIDIHIETVFPVSSSTPSTKDISSYTHVMRAPILRMTWRRVLVVLHCYIRTERERGGDKLLEKGERRCRTDVVWHRHCDVPSEGEKTREKKRDGNKSQRRREGIAMQKDDGKERRMKQRWRKINTKYGKDERVWGHVVEQSSYSQLGGKKLRAVRRNRGSVGT